MKVGSHEENIQIGPRYSETKRPLMSVGMMSFLSLDFAVHLISELQKIAWPEVLFVIIPVIFKSNSINLFFSFSGQSWHGSQGADGRPGKNPFCLESRC